MTDLQKTLETFVDAGFSGVSVRLRDQQREWVGSAGVREPGGTARWPADGHFWAGSVAKPFTATLVLHLAAEGKLDLEAPIAPHLPDFAFDPRITARMLLQHTSGRSRRCSTPS